MNGADISPSLAEVYSSAQDVIDVGAQTIGNNIAFFFILAIVGIVLFVVKYIAVCFSVSHGYNRNIMTVNMDDVYPDETWMDMYNKGGKYRKKALSYPDTDDESPIHVVKSSKGGRKYYIKDGVHRYVKNMRRGKRTIDVEVMD